MKISVEGFVSSVMLNQDKNGNVVTDAFLVQLDKVIRCRWKGDVTNKITSNVKGSITGDLVSWTNEKGSVYHMVLCK